MQKITYKTIIITSVLQLNSTFANANIAETIEKNIEENIEETVVTASGFNMQPSSLATFVEVITSEDIKALGTSNLIDILATSTSIQIFDLNSSGTRAQVAMRGFAETSANNVAIMVDGVKLNNPSLAAPLLSLISPENIERIEIIKGSGSVLYGDQATAGVINIITKDAKLQNAQLKAGVASFNGGQLTVNGANSINDNLSVSYSLEQKNSDNYRVNNASAWQALNAGIDWQRDDLYINGNIQRIVDKLELPGALSSLDDRKASTRDNEFSNNSSTLYSLNASDKWTKNLDVKLLYNHRNTKGNGDLFGSFDRETTINDFDLKHIYHLDIGNNQLKTSFGLQHIDAGYINNNSLGVTDIEQKQDSIYLQNFFAHNKITANIGHRQTVAKNIDSNGETTSTYNVSSNEIAIKYKVNKHSNFGVGYNKGFRIANVDEFDLSATGELQPQVSENFEVNIDVAIENLFIVVSYYRQNLVNEILYDPTAGAFGLNVNIPASTRYGSQIDYKLNIEKWTFNLGLASIDATIDATGNKIPYVADYNANATINYKHSADLQILLDWQYTGDRYAAGDFSNKGDKVASYDLVNVALNYQIDTKSALALRINNLFSTEYESYQLYSNFGSSYYPAPPITFNLSYKYSF